MSAGITLSDAIMALVAEKRAVGYKYHAEQRVLARFEAFSRSEFPGLDTLTEASVQGWISAARRRGVKPATLQGLAAPVRELARWLGRRGVAAYLLPGSALPRPVRYVPHIYTDRELAALVAFSFISPTTGGVSGPGQADEHAWTSMRGRCISFCAVRWRTRGWARSGGHTRCWNSGTPSWPRAATSPPSWSSSTMLGSSTRAAPRPGGWR